MARLISFTPFFTADTASLIFAHTKQQLCNRIKLKTSVYRAIRSLAHVRDSQAVVSPNQEALLEMRLFANSTCVDVAYSLIMVCSTLA